MYSLGLVEGPKRPETTESSGEVLLGEVKLQEQALSVLQDAVQSLERSTLQLAKQAQGSQARQSAEMRSLEEKVVAALAAQQGSRRLEEQAAHLEAQVAELKTRLREMESEAAAVAARDLPRVPSEDREVRMQAAHPSTTRQYAFQNHGAYGFVRFSGYRTGPSSFAAIGLGLLTHRDNRALGNCRWQGLDGSQSWGRLRMEFPMEHHALRYEVAVVICDLERVVGVGGVGLANIDQEEVVLHNEREGELASPHWPARLRHEVQVCTAPVFGRKILPARIKEFVEYNKLLGADLFVFYDGDGIDAGFRAAFARDIQEGLVDIRPFRANEEYETWYHGQLLAQTDCMYSARYTARWVMMADFDEFFWIRNPDLPRTIPQLLAPYSEYAVVDHGCFYFTIFKCRPPRDREAELSGDPDAPEPPTGDDDDNDSGGRAQAGTRDDMFSIEKMVFRWPHVICWHNGIDGPPHEPHLCPQDQGHRKFFVNPRKVDKMGIHGVVKEEPSPPSTKMLSTEDVAQAHFQLFFVERTMCNETYPLAEPPDWWYADVGLPRFARSLRQGHKCNLSLAGNGCKKV